MKLLISPWLRLQWQRHCLAIFFALGLLLSHLFSSLSVQAMEPESMPERSLGKEVSLGKIEQAQMLSNSSIQHQRLGQWAEAQRLIDSSLELLSQSEQTTRSLDEAVAHAATLGQALNTQGSLSLATGKGKDALEQWQRAEAAYRQAQDEVGVVRSQINQAQALQTLGFYRRAIAQLSEVNQTLSTQQPNPRSEELAPTPPAAQTAILKITALQRWGELLRLTGNIPLAKTKLEQSLRLAQQLDQSQKIPSLLLSLGYVAQADDDPEAAIAHYEQAVEQAQVLSNPQVVAKGHLAQLELAIHQSQWDQVDLLWPKVFTQLSQLPPSRSTLYQRIHLVQLLAKVIESRDRATPLVRRLMVIATETLDQAEALGDLRSTAYAQGNLGQVYLLQQQWQVAERHTRMALEMTQALQAPDMLWRWQGQLGYVKQQQNDRQGAIAAYRSAVSHLDTLRSDLVAMHSGLQYSFQEDIEPLYRQLIGLLLEDTSDDAEAQFTEAQQLVEDLQGIELDPITRPRSSSRFIEAQQLMEKLQLMELEDFLREFCNSSPEQLPVDRLDSDAAILRFIILRDRVEILVNFPNQPIKRYRTNIAQTELEQQLGQLQRTLVIRSRRRFLTPSQQLYDELIRPIEADLAAHQTQTLVFALDGALQSIPMAALHDGEQFLVERYRIALIPRLRLQDTPALGSEQLQSILAAGLSEPRRGFSPLPQVNRELSGIMQQFPQSRRLQNQAFTEANFQKHLHEQNPAIVHIATHGQFSSKAKETFLLAWDSLIHVGRLDALIQSGRTRGSRATELMVLSACETAVGDERASLGLAGVAFKAGAQSTLATLWVVNDEASAIFMEQFYQALKQPGTSRSEALQQAQRSMLKDSTYKHPLYWAPYIMLGSWW